MRAIFGRTLRGAPALPAKRWLASIVAMIVATTGLVGVSASPAAADCCLQYSYIHSTVSGGAWLRAQPSTSAYGIEYLGNGQEVLMLCWVDAQWVYPPDTNYASNRWFKVEPTYDVAIGYVHSALVSNQRSTPHCSS